MSPPWCAVGDDNRPRYLTAIMHAALLMRTASCDDILSGLMSHESRLTSRLVDSAFGFFFREVVP